jgi:hypothetical protein
MMNKKLVALLVSVLAIGSSLFAHYECYTDEDGVERCEKKHGFFRERNRCYEDGSCKDPVRGTVRRTGDLAEDTVEGTGRVAKDALNVGTLGIFER